MAGTSTGGFETPYSAMPLTTKYELVHNVNSAKIKKPWSNVVGLFYHFAGLLCFFPLNTRDIKKDALIAWFYSKTLLLIWWLLIINSLKLNFAAGILKPLEPDFTRLLGQWFLFLPDSHSGQDSTIITFSSSYHSQLWGFFVISFNTWIFYQFKLLLSSKAFSSTLSGGLSHFSGLLGSVS